MNRSDKAGLVERYQTDADRHVSRLRLTPDGRRLLARLSEAHLEESWLASPLDCGSCGGTSDLVGRLPLS